MTAAISSSPIGYTGPIRSAKFSTGVTEILTRFAPGIPFFMKQLAVEGEVRHDLADFPEDLRVQEFPTVEC
jgi:hypothetical protein